MNRPSEPRLWSAAVQAVLICCVGGYGSPRSAFQREQATQQLTLEQARAAIDRLVVMPSMALPELQSEMYYTSSGSAAGTGAAEGALAGLYLAAAGGISIVLAPITVPAGALIGSMYGAGSTVSPEHAAQAEAPTRDALLVMPVQNDFAAAVADALRRETAYPVSIQIMEAGQEPTATSGSVADIAGGGQAVIDTRIKSVALTKQLSRAPNPEMLITGSITL